MGLYQVTLFTKPISFEADEELVTPISWENVLIPTKFADMAIKYLMPINANEYKQSNEEITDFRRQWLNDLAKEGYTAVRLTALQDGITAEATKDVWKR